MVEGAVREFLLADGPVAAIVGTRGWLLVLPEQPVLPAFRVQLISRVPDYTHDGESGLYRARVQVDAVTKVASGVDPYAQAMTLSDAIHTRLSGYQGEMGSSSPPLEVSGVFADNRVAFYDAEEKRHVRVVQDFLVLFRQ